jgi:glycerol transport system ATP-binding protein
LFDTPQHTFVGKFIGSPGMNILPCELHGAEAVIQGHRIALAREYPALTGVIELGIRPEFVRLTDSGQGMPVQIKEVEDVGRHRIARAFLHDHPLNIIVPELQPIPGEPRVVFDSDRINVYQNSQLVTGERPS